MVELPIESEDKDEKKDFLSAESYFLVEVGIHFYDRARCLCNVRIQRSYS